MYGTIRDEDIEGYVCDLELFPELSPPVILLQCMLDRNTYAVPRIYPSSCLALSGGVLVM